MWFVILLVCKQENLHKIKKGMLNIPVLSTHHIGFALNPVVGLSAFLLQVLLYYKSKK